MKNLINVKDVKSLSKTEQQSVMGGRPMICEIGFTCGPNCLPDDFCGYDC